MEMQKIIAMVAFWWALAPVSAADFESGKQAYNNRDYAAALREWLPLAEAGEPRSQFYLGHMYRLGRGVPKDVNEAIRWYRSAANQGYAEAQNAMGNCYNAGIGVSVDYAEAMRWYPRMRIPWERGPSNGPCRRAARIRS